MFTVYGLYNEARDSIYIGYTSDIEKRLRRHNQELPSKKTSYTKRLSGTWIMFYDEPAADKKAAMLREKQLKSAKGREFLWSIVSKSSGI